MDKRTKQLIIIILMIFLSVDISMSDEAENKPILIGEHFTYRVKWNNLPVGAAELEVLETTEIQGYPVYHVINRVWSEGVVALFFKVENTIESFIDVKNLFSRRYVKNVKEGRYRDTLTVDFDQVNHLAIRGDTTFVIPENIQDPLSILWYFREQKIKEYDTMSLCYSDGKKNRILQVKILKKEKVSTPLGKFLTDVIEFSVGGKEREYLKKEVRLKIWFSDDEMRMPVLIKAKASVGSITGMLIKSDRIIKRQTKDPLQNIEGEKIKDEEEDTTMRNIEEKIEIKERDITPQNTIEENADKEKTGGEEKNTKTE